MPADLALLAASIVLGFVYLLLAATAATRVRGRSWNAGPRDEILPPLTGIAGRLERASRNFTESFPFFAAALLLAYVRNQQGPATVLGAQLYFWARVVYLPLYAAGIPYVRSLVWLVSVAGIGIILLAAIGWV